MPKPPYPVSRAGRWPLAVGGADDEHPDGGAVGRGHLPLLDPHGRHRDRTRGGLVEDRLAGGEVEAAHLLRRDEVGPADPQPALLRGTGRVGRRQPGQRPEPGQRDGGARRAVPVVQRHLGGGVAAADEREQAVGGVGGAGGLQPPHALQHGVGVLGDQLPPVLAAGRGGIGDGEAEAGGAVGGEQVQPAVALHPRGAPHVVGLGEHGDEGDRVTEGGPCRSAIHRLSRRAVPTFAVTISQRPSSETSTP